ncbi:SPOR domain-containing protein, partial [bacterium]|nr:SPOR domain-containing protein [bacterium]
MIKKTIGIFLFLLFFLPTLLFADYSIQLGSFKTENRAKTAKNGFSKELKAKFLFVTKSNLGKKGIWFRVKYGRFQDKAKATEIMNSLKEKNIPSFLTLFPKSKTMDYFFSKNNDTNPTEIKTLADTKAEMNIVTLTNNDLHNIKVKDTPNIPLKIND